MMKQNLGLAVILVCSKRGNYKLGHDVPEERH